MLGYMKKWHQSTSGNRKTNDKLYLKWLFFILKDTVVTVKYHLKVWEKVSYDILYIIYLMKYLDSGYIKTSYNSILKRQVTH